MLFSLGVKSTLSAFPSVKVLMFHRSAPHPSLQSIGTAAETSATVVGLLLVPRARKKSVSANDRSKRFIVRPPRLLVCQPGKEVNDSVWDFFRKYFRFPG